MSKVTLKINCQSRVRDLSGQKFGRLTVLGEYKRERTGKSRHIIIKWRCVCDCGNEKWVRSGHLTRKSGATVSCGCFQQETRKLKAGLAAQRHCFSNYQASATRRKLTFNILFDYFVRITTSPCYYCGEAPSQVFKNTYGNGNFVYNGIDRVNNKIGYVIGNCVPCCKRCNAAKSDMSQDEFYTLIRKIYSRRAK